VGYRLWTGKPRRSGIRHPGLLSLNLSRLEWVPGVGRESKQAYRVVHQPVSRGFAQCSLMPSCRIGLRRSAPTYVKR